MPSSRVQLRVPADALAEIDVAARAAGVSRSEYVISAALGRARGRLELPEAWAVVEAHLRDAGLLG